MWPTCVVSYLLKSRVVTGRQPHPQLCGLLLLCPSTYVPGTTQVLGHSERGQVPAIALACFFGPEVEPRVLPTRAPALVALCFLAGWGGRWKMPQSQVLQSRARALQVQHDSTVKFTMTSSLPVYPLSNSTSIFTLPLSSGFVSTKMRICRTHSEP